MTDFPRSLLEFQQRFPDEEACAAYLAILRWPAGFVLSGLRQQPGVGARDQGIHP